VRQFLIHPDGKKVLALGSAAAAPGRSRGAIRPPASSAPAPNARGAAIYAVTIP
jgi:hypothetical protein